MNLKEEWKKAGLNLNIKKTKTMILASGPIISWQIEGGKVEEVIDFSFLDFKTTTVTATMNLKDAFSSEGKLWQS